MNKFSLAVLLSLVLEGAANASTFTAHVVSVTDGDTIKVLTSENRLETIRLNGIDCPEKKQAFGVSAKEFTSRLVLGRDVVLDEHGHDRYGRIIGDVLLRDGTSVNYALVQNGYAWWYRKYSHDVQLARLEQQARQEHLGLWSDPQAEAPWDFRHPTH
jgi:micrococcal nuclease